MPDAGFQQVVHRAAADTRVVHQNIQPAIQSNRISDNLVPARFIGDVQRHVNRGAAGVGNFTGNDLALAFQLIGDDDLGAFFRKPPSRRGAHAGCRAAHDRHFVGQTHGMFLHFENFPATCHAVMGLATGR